MSIDEKVLRINELAKKAKTVGLSDDEKLEQKTLREQYIKGFRDGLNQTLDNTFIVDEHGNKTPIKQKK